MGIIHSQKKTGSMRERKKLEYAARVGSAGPRFNRRIVSRTALTRFICTSPRSVTDRHRTAHVNEHSPLIYIYTWLSYKPEQFLGK